MKKIKTQVLAIFMLLPSFQLLNAQDSIKLIDAQVRNQVAQAEFYSRQRDPIEGHLITFFGSLVAAFVALFIAIRNIKNEREKLSREREIENQKTDRFKREEVARNTRLAAADLLQKVAEGFHCLTWVLWTARHTKNEFDKSLIVDYNKKMNLLYSEIVGCQVTLAAYNLKLYEETEEIQKRLYHEDENANILFSEIKSFPPSENDFALQQLGGKWKEIYDYANDLPTKFARILERNIPPNL